MDEFAGATNPFQDNQVDDFSDAVNPFGDAVNPFAEEDAPGFFETSARRVGERSFELAGNLVDFAGQAGDALDNKFSMGGFVFEGGSVLPRYATPSEYQNLKQQGMTDLVDQSAESIKAVDFNAVPKHTWEEVKRSFTDDGVLSGLSETVLYGAEQGIASIPDMVAAWFALPGYVLARSAEIGESRAKHKGKEKSDITDTLEAMPFAVGSSLLERVGAGGIANAGKDVAEELGKGMMKAALKGAAKAGTKEAATEFVQEGVIEYIGERLGTDAAIRWQEGLDRGISGAVAGGVYGGGAGGVNAGIRDLSQGDDTSQQVEEIADIEQPQFDAPNVDANINPVQQDNAAPVTDQADVESAPLFNPDEINPRDPNTPGDPRDVVIQEPTDTPEPQQAIVENAPPVEYEEGVIEDPNDFDSGLVGDLETVDQPSAQALDIDEKANAAAASQQNDLPAPTEAQKQAGNYKKGKPFSLHGLNIVIENPKGSERSGKDSEGNPWSNTMVAHYGDIKRSKGADGDAVDVFVGGDPSSEKAWVIDQIDPKTGKFDEHKVMLGFRDESDARQSYLSSYDEGWNGIGEITEIPAKDVKDWALSSDAKKPFSDKLIEKKVSTLPKKSEIISNQESLDISVSASGKPFKTKVSAQASLNQKIKSGNLQGDYHIAPVDGGFGIKKGASNSRVEAKAAPKENKPVVSKAAVSNEKPTEKPKATKKPVESAPSQEKSEDLPPILIKTRKAMITAMAKKEGLRKGSPGYADSIKSIEEQHDIDLDKAEASLTFEQFKERNPGPETFVRSAYEQLRAEHTEGKGDTLETKETDKGTMLFSKSPKLPEGATPKGVKEDLAKAHTNRFSKRFKGASDVKLEVHANPEDILGKNYKEKHGLVKAAYLPKSKTIYIFNNHHDNVSDLEKTLKHEVVVHVGLGLFDQSQIDKIYSKVYQVAKNDKRINKMWREVHSIYDSGSDRLKVEEVLARIAEDTKLGRFSSSVRKIYTIIRQALQSIGVISNKATLNDVHVIISDMADRLRAGENPGDRDTGTLFSKGGNGADSTNAERPDSSSFAVPDETLATVAIRRIQDKHKVLKDVVHNIKDSGGSVTDKNNAYLAEELFHGKAENDLRLMQDTFVKPIADKMAKYGIELGVLDKYLIAKHAKERNEHIASINDKFPDGGSGMKTAAAEKYLSDLPILKAKQLSDVAGIVYDMIDSQRQLIRESGLESDAMVDAWESKYKFYIPLKGIDDKGNSIPATGKGFSIKGRESKRALGRSSTAESPVSHAINDLTEKLIRKRKNEVGNALLELIKDNPNKDYWEVFTDESPDVDRRIVKTAQGEQVQEQSVPMAMFSENYFTTKKNGKTYYMKLHDERLMKSMKNIGPEGNNTLIRTLSSLNRVMSALNTSYNPEFIISNFSRDIQTAILNLHAEQSRDDGKIQGEKIAKQVVKDTPKAAKAIYNSLRTDGDVKSKNKEWSNWFDEFREQGAKTGWFDMKDIDGQAAAIDDLVNKDKGSFRKVLKYSADWVEHTNQSVENAVRLSAYVNARRAGVSKVMSASLAKNMTVNFNRRGELGTTMNALFLFANASTQGVANFARTMHGLNQKTPGSNVWSRMNNAQKVAVGITGGAIMLAMANRMLAGDDDDGENFYDKIPAYVKERNLVIMKSMYGGKPGEYWKIPLPYGYNVFYVLGAGIESAFNNPDKIARESANMALATLGSFSPIGFQDSNTLHGLLLKNATPTIAKPVLEIALNENFAASSIYNKNYPFGTQKPDSSLARRSTPSAYTEVAKFMNSVTGGSEYRTGVVDINPDIIQHIVEFYGGGAYRLFGTKIPDTVERLATDVPLEAHRVPFAGKVTGKVLPYADISKFYERRKKLGQIEAEAKSLKGKDRREFSKDFGSKLSLIGLAKSTEKQLRSIRKQKTVVYSNTSLSAKERDERLKKLDEKIKQAVDRFNRRFNQAA